MAELLSSLHPSTPLRMIQYSYFVTGRASHLLGKAAHIAMWLGQAPKLQAF
jgi:hypothetical protein